MIITIDGPTASGKSSVARQLAKELNYLYLNTGLMFRAVAYLLYIKNQSLNLKDLVYTYTPENDAQILYKDSNITPLLKTPEIDLLASQVAIQPEVRKALLTYQQRLAQEHNVVAEGRDTGTVVFPQAEHKFFITADLDVRAQRWQQFQATKGNMFTFEESKEFISKRDTRDTERALAPLRSAPDALTVDTSTMTIDQAVSVCLTTIRSAA